jgi:hypothetical protein
VFVQTLLAGIREYVRTPVLLVLLVFLPAYFVLTFAVLVPETTVQVSVPGDGTMSVTMQHATAVAMTPMVGALVGGIAGLFVMQSARETDARFVIVGADSSAVLLGRLGLLVLVSVGVGFVSTGALMLAYVPENPILLFLAVVLGALLYGLVGILAGVVLNRLAGVYLLLIGTMLDMFIIQNRMSEPPEYAQFLPGHAPIELGIDAGFSTTVGTTALLEGVVALVVLGTVTWVTLRQTMEL